MPLKRIELKAERGQLIYKLRRAGGSELWVNAADGAHFPKGQYERIVRAGADGVPVRTTDWGKILIDLHTGKIGGEAGKAVMTCAAVLLLLLTCSGVYVWLKPLLIRRESRLSRARVGLPAEAV
ncbi:MAG TPA: PepSY domain-containing protein [Verrucomicrobiae bacterium]